MVAFRGIGYALAVDGKTAANASLASSGHYEVRARYLAPDLVLTKRSDHDVTSVTLGENIVYTLSVTNIGISDAEKVVITDVFQYYLDFTVMSMPSFCTQPYFDEIRCDIGALKVNNTTSFNITVRPDYYWYWYPHITNEATALSIINGSQQADLDFMNNRALLTVNIDQ